MALSHSPSIVTDGLVLCLDAANRKSYPGTGTGWNNLSGLTSGILLNGITFSNSNNGVLVFDGTDDYVSTSLISQNSFTWSAWFKTDVVSDTFRNIISISAPSYMLMLLTNGRNNLSFWSPDGLNDNSLGTDSISINTWYNIVFVREGNSITNGYKAYFNGSFKGSANTGSWSSSDPIIIGGRTDATQFFDGSLANICVYSRALSAQEISQNFNALRGRFGI